MNKLIKPLFILFLVISNNTFAQSIDGVPLKDLDVEYIEIQISINLGHNITVSYSEHGKTNVSNKKSKFNSLRDKEGNVIVLSTRIAALNFFAKNGFELVESFTTESPNFHYLILRRKDE